jgi:hypothetical protein
MKTDPFDKGSVLGHGFPHGLLFLSKKARYIIVSGKGMHSQKSSSVTKGQSS